jgi:hypothetical protein
MLNDMNKTLKQQLSVIVLISLIFPHLASAMYFSGNSSWLAYLAGAPNEPSSQMTEMIWFYSTSTISTNETLFSSTSTGALQNASLMSRVNGDLRCIVIAGGVLKQIDGTANTVTPFAWHHLACTYDGANIRIYLDGASAATAVAQSGTLAQNVSYYIGTRVTVGGTTGGTNGTQGSLAQAYIFNRALSANEIRNYYYTGAVSRNGLVHYFPLWNNGSDFSSNRMDATTTGYVVTGPLPPMARYRKK